MRSFLAILAVVFSACASALPVTINDLYVGGNDHGYGDVIGNTGMFGISSMEVELNGTVLSVTVNTPFPDSGLGSFASYTNTAQGQGNGIGFGDLFLSSSGWNPSGSAPWLSDDHSTGTVWDYGVSLTDRWDPLSGSALYALNAVPGNPDAWLSEDFVSGATFRNGQEVAIRTGQAILLPGNDTSFGTAPGQVLFQLDIAGTALEGAGAIGLHWAMTCGNDTIEGEFKPVPEPSTLAMLLLGLMSVGYAGIRRRGLATSPDQR